MSAFLPLPSMPLPSIIRPSSVTVQSMPSVCRPSAITAIRSDSFTRNSFAPVNTVRPWAQLAAINNTGNSSIAKGTKYSGISIPFRLELRIVISATGSPPTWVLLLRLISAFINFKISMIPVRVGLIPTCVSVSSLSWLIAAATIKKAADEISAGTAISPPVSVPPPSTLTRLPSTVTG